ncbi:hypothetical protein [Yersinia pseudotuberculosis]|uniref:Uncharacterized protein api58 n=2 Tax=Yersinia pseudotuberculosis TaxID=633 RepID=Q6EVS1_YERPU|nr:hypothetical protein [Yersinia pseudotuberculosis]MBO1632089.1 hypothetical protein [Yersinia pseudotuberculosis]CAF28532.1 hypothetical protein [Yersinia pseudotuberculosis]CFV32397.1 Uncharacterised protein [Yersinia pseudotuberculosis]CNE56259.1 Uncharacterised protein [Yersinia pseudotuberculosis]CNL27812.1 Uncharacterised protein [Yersinia pseudotuberculosis]
MSADSYDIQLALNLVGTANSRREALYLYEKNKSILKDWRIIYADESKSGPFKLTKRQFSEKGIISTVFYGNSLWVIDNDVLSSSETMAFKVGFGLFVDSNAASYIRSLAYREAPKEKLLNFCRIISDSFSFDDLSTINPYLYLWEAQSDRRLETINGIRETLAALFALPHIKQPLNAQWGETYRTIYRKKAEEEADCFLFDFYQQLDAGLGQAIEDQIDMMEIMLIKTKLLELTSSKEKPAKMEELVLFMHEKLSTLMFRELLICADIIFHERQSQMSNKLHGLLKNKNPLGLLRNCATDLYMVRALDQLTNASLDDTHSIFYIANLITFDRDIADVLKLSELRAMALHRSSSLTFPIYKDSIPRWLKTKIGGKGVARLSNLFTKEQFEERARQRNRYQIKSILAENRLKITELIKSQQ